MRRAITAVLAIIPFFFLLLPAVSSQAVTKAPATPAYSGPARPSPHLDAATAPARTAAIVRAGSSLSAEAARLLGSARDWPVLWWDNRGKIPNPDAVRSHLWLHYGTWDYVRPWLWKRAMAAIPKPAPPPPRTHTQAAASPAQQSASQGGGAVVTGGFEACVIAHESGGNPGAVNPTSGAGGLFQFLPSTWASLGFAAAYPGGAQTAPASVQEQAFAKLYAEAGTSPWAPYDGC